MEFKEYQQQAAELEQNYMQAKKALAIKYALANSPVKAGAVIKSTRGELLEVKRIVTYLNYKKPSCIYYGTELKKDLTPKARQHNCSIYQEHLTEIVSS